MAKRTVTFKPAPIDGDGDGIVQEGTEFERPIDAPGEEPCDRNCGEDCKCEEYEAHLAETYEPKAVPNPRIYIAEDGDSYAAIAGKFPTEGMSKHERSQELYQLNGGKPLNVGTEVKL